VWDETPYDPQRQVDAYRQAFGELVIIGQIGYNPQLLLEPPSFERDMRRGWDAWARERAEMDFAFHHQTAWDAAVLGAALALHIDVETCRLTGWVDVGSETIMLIGHMADGETVTLCEDRLERTGIVSNIIRAEHFRKLHVEEIRPAPDYLQHDPTKNVRRRHRGR